METTAKHQIKETIWPEKIFLAKKDTVAFDKLTEFFGKSYGEIYGALGQQGIQPTESPCAIYYSIDEKNNRTELAAAVPVPNGTPDMQQFQKITVPAGKALTTTHYGSYDSMTETYGLMEKHMTEYGLERAMMLEEYLSDPDIEKDPANWKTNIYFILK